VDLNDRPVLLAFFTHDRLPCEDDSLKHKHFFKFWDPFKISMVSKIIRPQQLEIVALIYWSRALWKK